MTLTLGKGPLATREDVRSKLTRGDKVPTKVTAGIGKLPYFVRCGTRPFRRR